MIIIQREPPIRVSGREFIAVARIELTKHVQGGALLITADKRPVAVICHGEGYDEIYDINGCRIDDVRLQVLIDDQGQ